MKYVPFIVVFVLLLASVFSTTQAADVETPVPSRPAYCGLYAVYGALVHEERAIDFASLLNQKYMACSRGSSMAELKQAAEDFGLHTLPLNNMTTYMLRHANAPVILYTRMDFYSATYDHYLLFLRYVDGKYECNSGDERKNLSEGELLALWSRSGMVLSAQPLSSTAHLGGGWLSYAEGPALIVLMLLALIWLKHRFIDQWATEQNSRFPAIRTFVQGGYAVGITLAVAIMFNCASAGGLLAYGNQTDAIALSRADDWLPRVSTSQAGEAFDRHTAQFIDARLQDDFDSGHVNNAINLPVDLPEDKFVQAVKSLPKESHLIVK